MGSGEAALMSWFTCAASAPALLRGHGSGEMAAVASAARNESEMKTRLQLFAPMLTASRIPSRWTPGARMCSVQSVPSLARPAAPSLRLSRKITASHPTSLLQKVRTSGNLAVRELCEHCIGGVGRAARGRGPEVGES